ncbi:hypothetical protein OC845_006482, partial [Tilletia horrida]
PSRAGVVALALLNMTGAFTSISYLTKLSHEHHLHRFSGFMVLERLLILIVSTFGLIGAVYKRRALVKTYSAFLWGFFCAYILLDALTLAAVWPARKEFERGCYDWIEKNVDIDERKQPNWKHDAKQLCRDTYKPTLIAVIMLLGLVKFFELWTCMIVHKYKKQLDDEASENQELSLGAVPRIPALRGARVAPIAVVVAPPSYTDIEAEAPTKANDTKLVDDAIPGDAK